MNIVIDATMLAPGGGLTGLVHYLTAWRDMACFSNIVLVGSRPAVLEAAAAADPSITAVPFACNLSGIQRFALRQLVLGRRIDRYAPDVVLTTNSTIANCNSPQVVHQRNSLRFLQPFTVKYCTRAGITRLSRDIGARRAASCGAHNVFVSHFILNQARACTKEVPGRWHVIHNGIADAVLNDSTSLVHNVSQPVLASITSDAPHKDNVTLVRILADLVRRAPAIPWQLHIAGGGRYTRERQLASELNVADRVHWLGFLCASDVDRLLKESVVLIFPTRLESFGNPPLEAMARKCPVVASNCSAIPEVVGNAGVLCPPGDVEAFAHAVLEIWLDKTFASELGERGHERAGLFRWTRSAQKMSTILCNSV